LRRIALIVTALGALGMALAGSALASGHARTRHAARRQPPINTYTTKLTFTTRAAGSPRKPVPIGFTQDITAKGTDGNRTAVLTDLQTRIYGLVANNGNRAFPTCTANQIAAAQTDAGCPKGAEVATGYITATLGSSTNFKAPGQACDPQLDVWNAGPGQLVFFFVDTPTHQCLGGALHTGQVGPYKATLRRQGRYLVLNVPIPTFVDYPLGTAGGLAGSLETEHLVWRRATVKVHGKAIPLLASVACQGHTRPYSQRFTATLPSSSGPGITQTATISHKAPC